MMFVTEGVEVGAYVVITLVSIWHMRRGGFRVWLGNIMVRVLLHIPLIVAFFLCAIPLVDIYRKSQLQDPLALIYTG